MAKTQVCVSLDIELVEKFKKLWPNGLSSYINEQVRRRINLASNDIKNVNMQLLTEELKEITEKVDHFTTKQAELLEKIRLIKDVIQKEEQRDLELEKERIESASRCALCGGFIDDKLNIVQLNATTKICKACYDPNNPRLLELMRRT